MGCEGTEIIADLQNGAGSADPWEEGVDDSLSPDAERQVMEPFTDTDGNAQESVLRCGDEVHDGNVYVDDMSDLRDLFGVTRIRGDLTIGGSPNDNVLHLNDLVYLLCVDGDIVIEDNHRLGAGALFGGLSMLWNIGGDLEIVDNDILPTCEATTFVDIMRQRDWSGAPCVFANYNNGCSDAAYQSGCH